MPTPTPGAPSPTISPPRPRPSAPTPPRRTLVSSRRRRGEPMPFVHVAGGDRLHYLDVGRGPVCVLLHGFGMQAAHFLPFVLPLAHRHRFVLIDLRGFGGS